MIDPRNPAFLINDEKSWRVSKWVKFHWRWWVWVFWREVWIRRYRSALAAEEKKL